MTKRSLAASHPDYRVRVSRRAKHVSIRVSHRTGVEVVVPPGYDLNRVPTLVEKRQEWIARTLQRLEQEKQAIAPGALEVLPQRIELRSIPENWTVSYQPQATTHLTATPTVQRELRLVGPTDNQVACQQVLRKWLEHKARYHLVPWLRQVSHEVDLPYQRASIRHQKTRWASCSSRQSISLNAKLLFLPPPLVRYVFIHELCHTVHMNHSRQFWALVGEKDPEYERWDEELRKAWCYVPAWAETK